MNENRLTDYLDHMRQAATDALLDKGHWILRVPGFGAVWENSVIARLAAPWRSSVCCSDGLSGLLRFARNGRGVCAEIDLVRSDVV